MVETLEGVRLNIRTEAELRDMMREMLPEFLKKVDPREDGFLDTLYASLLLTDTDNESLSGKDVLTRKDQARKLWFILSKVPLDDFISKVAPELCSKYPHIIPPRFRCYNGQDVIELEQVKGDNSSEKCLRCAIQDRIRATSMADMLYSMNFLDFEDYGDVISSKFEEEAVWMALFSAFCERTESEIDALMEGLGELLKRYSICTPPVLKDVLTAGFPCTCDEPLSIPPKASSVPVKKVGSWLRKTRFSLGRSSVTSRTTPSGSSRFPASTTTRRTFDLNSACIGDERVPDDFPEERNADVVIEMDEATEDSDKITGVVQSGKDSCILEEDEFHESGGPRQTARCTDVEDLVLETTEGGYKFGTKITEANELGIVPNVPVLAQRLPSNKCLRFLWKSKCSLIITVVLVFYF